MGVLSGNPQQEPMHYGEVFGVWSWLASTKGLLVGYQTLMNHAGDQDLKKFLEDSIRSMKGEVEQVEALLKANGVELVPTPAEKPIADRDSIPVGARFTDMEISASLTRDFATGLVACSAVIGECIREDIAIMFGQFHLTKAQFGARLLRMNKEKGWLVPPPLHKEAPELVHA
ncbi:hypothetical protein BEP19_08760 [Ammoniphilus oxalaticus]|uniref:DUF3231 domain-containing protein n=1 Tax=Ammoniphilus oxalaticus TaxID=66863 RepID=A0A419SKM7_9BACL|nr:DUF3231 family protein [Ammoniphilus oxalaticus]RKD24468.1 hypothetical protein BEP19_08760 [Ammoniphilus oxalaticus]